MAQKINIQILDNLHVKIPNKPDIGIVAEGLEYQSVWWRQGPFGRTKQITTATMINKRSGLFMIGLLDRVKKHLKSNGYKWNITGEVETLKPERAPALNGIQLRPDQIRLVEAAIKHRRGIIHSPTGSGKTVLAMSIMSAFPNAKILFLCHSISILQQTHKEFKEFGFTDIGFIGSGKKKLNGRIMLASISSFTKLDPNKYSDKFDITIIDECHHAPSASYKRVMGQNLSPMKIGLTATLPEEHEKRLIMEAFIGPVLEEVTIQEGVDNKILAKPRITFINSGELNQDLRTYNDIYSKNIVHNVNRNTTIIKECIKRVRKGKTVLIMIKNIEHGIELMDIVNHKFRKYNESFTFIQGSTEGKLREEVRENLNNKDVKVVICTAIWKEGVNIPTLNSVLIAGGGKSDIMTAQSVGRGLRTAKGKSEIEIIDILDDCKYLSQHAIKRFKFYLESGWL